MAIKWLLFFTFSVMSFGPVVSSSRLAKHEIVWPEDLSIRSRSDRVHGTRLQVDQHSPWHVFSSRCFIVVDVDPLQLQIAVTMIGAGGVNAVLIRDDFPELEKKCQP